jgi:Domain of unknown function (DUF4337)
MPGHVEVETKELQEAISELQEERAVLERGRERGRWLNYVGLTTALLAVFAAVAAVQAATLINQALINQLKASDTWAEYQASREKDHLYTLALNAMADAGGAFSPRAAAARTKEYRGKVAEERAKENDRSLNARKLETESAFQIHKQHYFEYSVGLIQVAIALSAIAALAKVKPVWYAGLLAGAVGIVLFAAGFLV